MKAKAPFLILSFTVLLLLSCNLSMIGKNTRVITPSNNRITQTRDVSGFTSINLGAFGTMNITQGDKDSLTINGSDNVIPLIQTTVTNGVLNIQVQDNVISTNPINELTYTVTVKDLSSLMISGAGNVTMPALNTQAFEVNVSGAGNIKVEDLKAGSLNINLSGLGGIDLAGNATTAKIDISGAGNIQAGNLKLQTADVSLSGAGNATLWVTDRLTGTISGVGGVSYYGNPPADVKSSGVGQFKSLGSK